MGTNGVPVDTAKIVTIQTGSVDPKAYTAYINALIGHGIPVQSTDGYMYYPVMGIAFVSPQFMQVTYRKHGMLICDMVSWEHSLLISCPVIQGERV